MSKNIACIIIYPQITYNYLKTKINLVTFVSPISHTDYSYGENLITCGLDNLTILMKKKIRHVYMSKIKRQRQSAQKE